MSAVRVAPNTANVGRTPFSRMPPGRACMRACARACARACVPAEGSASHIDRMNAKWQTEGKVTDGWMDAGGVPCRTYVVRSPCAKTCSSKYTFSTWRKTGRSIFCPLAQQQAKRQRRRVDEATKTRAQGQTRSCIITTHTQATQTNPPWLGNPEPP